MSNKKVIDQLTPDQAALLPMYYERFKQIGLSTAPTDRGAAEAAVRRAHLYLSKAGSCAANPEIIWADSPMKGAILAAQYAKGDTNVTNEEVRAQAAMASYGSFEAYWVSVYSFIAEQLDVEKDELADIALDIVTHCGVYWTFEKLIILTPKPVSISMHNEKLHSTTGMALQYENGDGLYAINGDLKNSLMEAAISSRNEADDEE